MPNILHGIVTKTGAMAKTVTVTISRKFEHPRLIKEVHRHHKMLVHDEFGQAKVGDRVSIIHGKPISKRKHFSIQSISPRRAAIGEEVAQGAGDGAPVEASMSELVKEGVIGKGEVTEAPP